MTGKVRSFHLYRPEGQPTAGSAEWALFATLVWGLNLALALPMCGHMGLVSLPGSTLAAAIAWWALLRKGAAPRGGLWAILVRPALRAWICVAVVLTTLSLLTNAHQVLALGL
ncbi:MAG: hypothetical protein ACYS8L_00220 [Planctomycetota bacterium]|jgi:hypothetical protein